MQDFARQAKRALAVYLERGRSALKHLEGGRLDEADNILNKRHAAFHNFRAADVLATDLGIDLSGDAEILAIWDEIRKVDRELETSLRAAHEETALLYQKLREARQAISKYRSGGTEEPRFTRTA